MVVLKMSKQWDITQPRQRGDVHILPIRDLRDHDERRTCWCDPTVMAVDGSRACVVTHNSADGRELVEAHGIN
jgi:hypothetical protein